jgi:hypothetical protein
MPVESATATYYFNVEMEFLGPFLFLLLAILIGTGVIARFAILLRLGWQQSAYFWLSLVVAVPEIRAVLLLLRRIFKDPNDEPKQRAGSDAN